MHRSFLGKTLWFALIFMCSAPLCFAQQEGPVNPFIPPPPPVQSEILRPPIQDREVPALRPMPAPFVPDFVTIPGGTFIDVVLDTPISTRISKDGQMVTFRTARPIKLEGGLELPPDTEIVGKVTKVRRPGAFGRAGELRVKVERIELPHGESSPILARLDTPDRTQGRISADRNRTVDLYNLGLWTLNGTLLGSSIGGGKGAGIGAGAGAAVALLIMASKRGPDVYLEPGMPFGVILDEPVKLSGKSVQAAQLEHEQKYGLNSSDNYDRRDSNDSNADRSRPRLHHRPRP